MTVLPLGLEFLLRELSNDEGKIQLYQPKSLIKPPGLFSTKNLNRYKTKLQTLMFPNTLDLENFLKASKENNSVFLDAKYDDLRGYFSEILANRCLEHTLKKIHPESNFHLDNVLSRQKSKNYILGLSGNTIGNTIIKRDEITGIHILQKNSLNGIDERKYGFKSLVELDGFMFLYRETPSGKRNKRIYVLEVKTSQFNSASLEKQRVKNVIFKRINQILKKPVTYIGIGFDEYIFSSDSNRLINDKIHETSNLLKPNQNKLGSNYFTAIPFPFSEEEFHEKSKLMFKMLQKQMYGSFSYDSNDETITLHLGDGRIINIPNFQITV